MSDLAESSASVTVDGKQYNRALAEEMARDVKLLADLDSTSWAIGAHSGAYRRPGRDARYCRAC